jgi:hypothetical protein
MKRAGRLQQKATYGPLSQQTLHTVLKRELLENFGFEQMGAIAELLITRFLALVERYAPATPRLHPFETLVLAVSKDERFDYGKRLERCQLVPVRVRLVTPEELQALAEGTPLAQLRPQMAARILHEAYAQGGVLAYHTLGLLCGLRSVAATGRVLEAYRSAHPGEVLPHSGTIFDLGPTLTHKAQAVLLQRQGLLEQEIARRINHHPGAVARYLNDHARVQALWEEGKDAEMIAFLTGISPSVVQQYIALQTSPAPEAAPVPAPPAGERGDPTHAH